MAIAQRHHQGNIQHPPASQRQRARGKQDGPDGSVLFYRCRSIFHLLTGSMCQAVGLTGALQNTDTKRYWNLTKNIYRFAYQGWAEEGPNSHAHTVDERMVRWQFSLMAR